MYNYLERYRIFTEYTNYQPNDSKEQHKWHILNIKIHIKLKYNIRYKIIREDTTRGYIEMIQPLVHYANKIFFS